MNPIRLDSSGGVRIGWFIAALVAGFSATAVARWNGYGDGDLWDLLVGGLIMLCIILARKSVRHVEPR